MSTVFPAARVTGKIIAPTMTAGIDEGPLASVVLDLLADKDRLSSHPGLAEK